MTVDQTGLRANPANFLQEAIKTHLAQSPVNRLKDIDGSPIYDEPLVGFADGDAPLFQDYKTIIGDFHLTPREVLKAGAAELGEEMAGGCSVSVISIILPLSKGVRASNRAMTDGPSLAWNHARWHGQDCADDVSRNVAALLRKEGFLAVIPDQRPGYTLLDLPSGLYAANWSQRHAAYAAGLGTFSLSEGFITPKGIAMRCTSVVTDLAITPTPRQASSRLANCAFFSDGSCKACIARCPGGAISPAGHDKQKCRETLSVTQKHWLKKPGYIGKYAGCGLCLTKVPCESRIPARARPKT